MTIGGSKIVTAPRPEELDTTQHICFELQYNEMSATLEKLIRDFYPTYGDAGNVTHARGLPYGQVGGLAVDWNWTVLTSCMTYSCSKRTRLWSLSMVTLRRRMTLCLS
jgi:hypothetical protein